MKTKIGSNIKSARRVLNALKKENRPVTKTYLSKKLGLNFQCVESVMDFLKELDLIEMIDTSARGDLFLWKQGK